jgi:hypothetical protein
MLVHAIYMNVCATPSNCGDTLKLSLLSAGGNTLHGQGNDLGSKNVKDE